MTHEMPQIITPAQYSILSIIRKHFPPEISRRFTVRKTSDIWNPKWDESTFNLKRLGRESFHVMFDMTEIFEVTYNADPRVVELEILRAFKSAIQNGTLSIERKPEYVSNEEVRRSKKRRQAQKKLDVIESIRAARDNPMTPEEASKHVASTTKKALKLQRELEISRQKNGTNI